MPGPLYVTQPDLPPLEEVVAYLERIWERKILTNGGPLHEEFEAALRDYLGVPHVSLFTNATIALLAGLKALDITGEVITTPYSFVATGHALLWNGLTPVFVDIDPVTLNLDPALLEAAITKRTTAIMPVHCYGNPCDVDAIGAVAEAHGLKVLYDAAHAFGVDVTGGSLLAHGDLSVVSFHATKVFHTFEGGAVISRDAARKRHVDRLKNFGFVDETTVVATGINGKMNEFQAAMGLVQLRYVDAAIARRAAIASRYRERLRDVPGIECVPEAGQRRATYGYFPILVGDGYALARDALYGRLREHGVMARRYFFPLISDFPMYRHLPSAARERLPVAADRSDRILCLPIYPALADDDVERVADLVTGWA
jgi:dTDP-4-amino-4,6-dideoxygalactose transaminase